MSKKLSEYQLQELYDWLNKFSLNKFTSTNKLHRYLSDGAIVAMLLKELYPKLVELHNYPTSSSVKLKRNNWETLNNKVLKKLGIQQSSNILDSIASSVPGFIEVLLFKIMRNDDAIRKEKLGLQIHEDDNTPYVMNDEIVMVNMNKQVGDAIIQVPQKMILYSIFEQTLRESEQKDIKIEVLYQKIVHLENILELKNERIEELIGQINKLTDRKNVSEEHLNMATPNTSYFAQQTNNNI